MPKRKPTKVYRYDGQSIWTSPESGYATTYSDYELGSFLGGGAAGVVYEAECFKTKRHLAVKVLNPIGYKLAPSGSLRFCEVVVKGQPYGDAGGGFGGVGGGRGIRGGSGGQGGLSGGGGGGSGVGGSNGGAGKMSEKHVWWLVNASTRQTIAAYYDARTGMLKEMTLPKCIEVWGLGDDKGRRARGRGGGRDRGKRDRERDRMKQEDRISRVFVGGEWLSIPSAPAKYDKFLRARASIFREISNMLQLTEHPNILRLHEALELVQDSKATIFLVLELARGGELFDRIKVDCGADEGAARHYFRQLLSGVRHCHDRGVCHRDLKPENLLLADPHDSSVLKIADFGFSALFRELESESSSGEDSSGPAGPGGVPGGPALRRPRSGLSMRDAVLREESGHGYDGTKADVWSMGVILYAMLAGNLPFEKELLTCSRFAKFGAWARTPSATASLLAHCSGNPKDAMDMDRLDYPSWFFPQHFSFAARSLLSGLLHPDASCRLSVRQVGLIIGCRMVEVIAASRKCFQGQVKTAGRARSLQEPSTKHPLETTNTREDVLAPSQDNRKYRSRTTGHVHRLASAIFGCVFEGSQKMIASATRLPLPPPPTQSLLGPAASPPPVVVVSAPTGRQNERGCTGGVGGTATEEEATVQTASLPRAIVSGPSGVRQEGTTVVPQADPDTIVRARQGQGTPAQEAVGGGRHASPPMPAPPPPTRVVAAVDGAVPSRLSIPPAESAEGIDRGEPRMEVGVCFGGEGAIAGGNGDGGEPFVTPRKLRSPRPLDVFSSPPLAPLGSGRALEGDSEFSLDASPALPPEKGRARSREGLPPSVPGHTRSRGESSSAFSVGVVERQLSMGVAGISLADAEVDKRESVAAAAPPAFHDLVKRSTRFMTSVPAAVVLRKIATIIDADAHPLPYPYRNIKQKAVVHQDDYKLEIMRGGVLVCTVQIYLLGSEQGTASRAQYMVEFLRGQLDIFLFKRFYEDVRCKLNDLVKKDYSLALLESGTCTHRFRRFSNLA
ncbi:unnamed protein product [Scytosiphon promiscuus]